MRPQPLQLGEVKRSNAGVFGLMIAGQDRVRRQPRLSPFNIGGVSIIERPQ